MTTHTHLTALCLWLPRWASTGKVKPMWIVLKQDTMSGSGISWAVCRSAPRCRQTTMPAPHHSVFLQAGCPSCRPTNSVKAQKALALKAKGLTVVWMWVIWCIDGEADIGRVQSSHGHATALCYACWLMGNKTYLHYMIVITHCIVNIMQPEQ